MADKKNIDDDSTQENVACESRREFLVAAKKWSKVVVAGAMFGSILFNGDSANARAWANRRGGSRGAWGNGRGGAWGNGGRRAWSNGGGGAWGNGGRRAWSNGSGSAWGNGSRRAWGNGSGGAWGNGGRTWANR
jgi:hypothetical protein